MKQAEQGKPENRECWRVGVEKTEMMRRKMTDRRHGARLGTPEGGSNSAREARAPKSENVITCKPLSLHASSLSSPQLASGHRGVPLGFVWGGREVRAVQAPSLLKQTISGGSHASMQQWSRGGGSPSSSHLLPLVPPKNGYAAATTNPQIPTAYQKR